jgi:hypothetical protein
MTATGPIAVFCPRCDAPPGEPCLWMEPLSYHAMRRVVAHNAESETERQRKFRALQEMLKPGPTSAAR